MFKQKHRYANYSSINNNPSTSDTMEEKPPPEKIERSTLRQFFVSLLANFASIAPSMSIGFSAVLYSPLTDESNPYRLSIEQASWIASISSLFTPLGCLLSGPIADRYGRKAAIYTINLVSFIGWCTIAVAYELKEWQFVVLLIGRILTGTSTGFACMPASIYTAEISDARWRGVLTTFAGMFFATGIFLVYFLGYLLKDNWGSIAVITAVFPVVSMAISLSALPESPNWLVINSRDEKAKKNMKIIFGHEHVEDEYQALVAAATNRDKLTFKETLRLLGEPQYWRPLRIILIFFFFQQASGCFVVVAYAVNVVQSCGITLDPYLISCALAVSRLCGSVFITTCSKHMGRRPPSIFSGIGMFVCTVTIGVYLTMGAPTDLQLLPILTLVAYFFTSTIGFITIPFAMAAECFPLKVRGGATGIVTCAAYLFNFVMVKTYPALIKSQLNMNGVFFLYAGCSLAATVFVIFWLPETKGKTLTEIEAYFTNGRSKRIVTEKSNEQNTALIS